MCPLKICIKNSESSEGKVNGSAERSDRCKSEGWCIPNESYYIVSTLLEHEPLF